MRNWIIWSIGLGLCAGGVVLAVGSCDSAGQVIQDQLHQDMMAWASLITILGVFTVFLGMLLGTQDQLRMEDRARDRQRRLRKRMQPEFVDRGYRYGKGR